MKRAKSASAGTDIVVVIIISIIIIDSFSFLHSFGYMIEPNGKIWRYYKKKNCTDTPVSKKKRHSFRQSQKFLSAKSLNLARGKKREAGTRKVEISGAAAGSRHPSHVNWCCSNNNVSAGGMGYV
jgi:hypothetical protein